MRRSCTASSNSPIRDKPDSRLASRFVFPGRDGTSGQGTASGVYRKCDDVCTVGQYVVSERPLNFSIRNEVSSSVLSVLDDIEFADPDTIADWPDTGGRRSKSGP